MRILYFYQYFGTPNGAWSTRVYEFARRWVRAGNSVTVVTSVYDRSDLKPEGLISHFDCDGIEVLVLNVRLSNKDGMLVRLWTFAVYALLSCWYALHLPADIVVVSSGPITVALPGLVAKFILRRPMVFEVRDLWPEGAIQLGVLRNSYLVRAARQFERFCYRNARCVVALSEGMASWIRDRHGFRHVEVVPNASDNEAFDCVACTNERPAPAGQTFRVVYTGTLGTANDCKQIVWLAECLRERNADEIEILVLGDGRERRDLELESEQRGLRNIQFLGLVPRDEWRRVLKEAGCILVVYKRGFVMDTASPNKLFDAFAAGRPVVQTTQGWIKTLFEREDCGITVPPDDPDRMADAILTLAGSRDLQAHFAKNAKRVARELFDREVLASRMLSVLREAAVNH
jgi:glycosyltransferase involved in cell wall biosynthesis